MNSGDLARLLAIPDREPDEGFVLRVGQAVEMEMADRAAARARREEVVAQLLGSGALLLAGRQIWQAGDEAAGLVLPLLTELGGLALVTATLFLFLILLSADLLARRT